MTPSFFGGISLVANTDNMIALYIFIWWAIGAGGFIYWWTRDYDFTGPEVFLCAWAGTMGPFAWPIGALIHYNGPVIKRRD